MEQAAQRTADLSVGNSTEILCGETPSKVLIAFRPGEPSIAHGEEGRLQKQPTRMQLRLTSFHSRKQKGEKKSDEGEWGHAQLVGGTMEKTTFLQVGIEALASQWGSRKPGIAQCVSESVCIQTYPPWPVNHTPTGNCLSTTAPLMVSLPE